MATEGVYRNIDPSLCLLISKKKVLLYREREPLENIEQSSLSSDP